MKKQWFLMFCLAGALAAGTKTYSVSIDSPAQVANAQLTPGEYRLALQGSKAVLTDKSTGKTVEANVKVATSAKKFSNTEVEYTTKGGVNRLEGIRLRGTRMDIEFN